MIAPAPVPPVELVELVEPVEPVEPVVAAEAAPAIAPDAAIPARTRRPSPLVVWVAILGVIGVVAALYLARAFFVPLLIGIFTSYALRPLVDWLKDRPPQETPP